ncbi:MAG: hypothetical protein ACRBBN_16925 [Methyloligellaceae bacterium]
MFAPYFSLPAKMIQSFTELTIANISNSMKIAGDMMNAGLQSSSSFAQTSKQTTSNEMPFPFTAFNYIPNLFKEEEKPVNPFMPINPFEAFQPKSSNNKLFPMIDLSNVQGQQNPFSSLSPFSAFSHLQPMFEKMRGATGGNSVKGAMIFFDIPLDSFKFDNISQNLPWASFPGLNQK